MNRAVIVLMVPMLLYSRAASAQTDENRVHVGVQLAGAVSGEFEETDVGFGGRLAWHPTAVVGVEAEVNWHPSEYDDEPAFSRSRVEGLFGVTIGPRLGTVRPFAKLRPGFLTYREAPEPIPCIAIFPPPLRCTLAAGDTVFALDIGGGIEWFPTGRTFARVDAGDRLVAYPGDENATGHDFRFTVGAGVRFYCRTRLC